MTPETHRTVENNFSKRHAIQPHSGTKSANLVPESAAFVPENSHLVPIVVRIRAATWQQYLNCAKICARFDACRGDGRFESFLRTVATVHLR